MIFSVKERKGKLIRLVLKTFAQMGSANLVLQQYGAFDFLLSYSPKFYIVKNDIVLHIIYLKTWLFFVTYIIVI